MTEKLTMERLETLLETMEPAQIREQYSAELARNPQCEQMLKLFEGMDQQLAQLKDLDTPPTFVPPVQAETPIQAAPIQTAIPFPKKPSTPVLHQISRIALPLAAVLVLGLLWGRWYFEDPKDTMTVADTPMEEPAPEATVAFMDELVDGPETEADAPSLSPQARPLEEPAFEPVALERARKETTLAEERQGFEEKDMETMKVTAPPYTADSDAVSSIALTKKEAAPLEVSALNEDAGNPMEGEAVAAKPKVSFRTDSASAGATSTDDAGLSQAMEEKVAPSPLRGKSRSKAKRSKDATSSTAANRWLSDFSRSWNTGKEAPLDLFSNQAVISWSLLEGVNNVKTLKGRWQELIAVKKRDSIAFQTTGRNNDQITVNWTRNGAAAGSLTLVLDANNRCLKLIQNP